MQLSAEYNGLKPRFVAKAMRDKQLLQRLDFIVSQTIPGEKTGTEHENTTQVFSIPADTSTGKPTMCEYIDIDNFDPKAPMFVYARVLEKKSLRWDHNEEKIDNDMFDNDAPRSKWIQERAWSSPIWYLPES